MSTFHFLYVVSQGEGVAYRGRLLVQLESKLGAEIEKELEVMKPDELIRVQVEKISLFQTAERNCTFFLIYKRT